MIRAALRSQCRYRVVAVGIDSRDRIISLATNTPRLSSRGFHAEERVISKRPDLALTGFIPSTNWESENSKSVYGLVK